jgi:HPt (histidine-containing phosphotransfer) domain-containing protein
MMHKLDVENLKKYINSNDILIKKLLTSFATNVPLQVQQLKQAALDKNAHETVEAAHKLKTPFLYFGLDDVANRLENIEQHYATMDNKVVLAEIDIIFAIGNDCAAQAKSQIEKLP